MLGLGVMINQLSGPDAAAAETYQKALGKTISALALDPEANSGDGALRFIFSDGSKMLLQDEGRSCCESRWMHTDDDLQAFVGATLVGIEAVDGPEEQDEYGEPKESCFVKVQTSAGTLTLVTYNAHNGYYGGFWLSCREEPSDA